MKASEFSALINNRYRLHELLGAGGMGMVFRATDRLVGQSVALKRVWTSFGFSQLASVDSPAASEQDRLRLALAHEFQTLAALHHPYIVNVLDYGFDEERQPYFTMEYLTDGETILEVGVNRSAGTIAYMAPETLAGEPSKETTGLYSVGIIAYELLAGRHPFDLEPISNLIEQILKASPALERLGVSDDLAGVIGRLLAKAPGARYARAEEALMALSRAAQLPPPAELAVIRESYLQAARFVSRAKWYRFRAGLGGVRPGQ